MTPLIIEGTPRSGTRFFCNFVEKQFGFKIFRLQRVIHKYSRNLHAYGNLEIESNFKKLLDDLGKEPIVKERIKGFDADALLRSVAQRSFEGLFRELLQVKANESGCDSWGMKFDNPSGMKICNELFPLSKFIHIVRDGRDVHLSACQCLSEGYYTPYNNALFWKKLITERKKFGASLSDDRYMEVKYEDLLADPKKVANAIARYIGASGFIFKKMDIKAKNFNKWKTRMSPSQIRAYESVAGELLSNLGYQKSCSDAKMSCTERFYYRTIEGPLKIRRYLLETLDPKTRQSVLRRIKLKIRDRLQFTKFR